MNDTRAWEENLAVVREALGRFIGVDGRPPLHLFAALDALDAAHAETVKALQDELDNWNPEARPTITERAERAEAELKLTVTALTQSEQRADQLEKALERVRGEIDKRWREYEDAANDYDDEGAHVGLARHSRAVAQGLGQAHTIALRAVESSAAVPVGEEPGT